MAKRKKKDAAAPQEPITPDDLRHQFRVLVGEAEETATGVRNRALAVGTGVLVVLIIFVFLLGRRRGRKATTIVEIIRV